MKRGITLAIACAMLTQGLGTPAMLTTKNMTEHVQIEKTADLKLNEETIEISKASPDDEADFIADGIKYKYVGDEIEIVGYTPELTADVWVPYDIDGKLVTSIADNAFRDANVKNIYLPPYITNIGRCAFRDCKNLVFVDMPYALEVIGEYAFAGSGITSLKLKEKLDEIPEGLCEDCVNLSKVSLMPGVKMIGQCAFINCVSLQFIRIPSTVTVIDHKAFASAGLDTVVVPDSVSIIDENAFSTESAITFYGNQASEIQRFVEAKNISWVKFSDNQFLYTKDAVDKCTIDKYVGVDTVVRIPDSIDDIQVGKVGQAAFLECYEITDVFLGNSVATISTEAFNGCSSLKMIEMPANVTQVEQGILGNFYGEISIYGKAGTYAETVVSILGNEQINVKFVSEDPCYGMDFEYEVRNGKATITKYLGSAKELTIPRAIDDYPVTEIRSLNGDSCENIESLVIPAEVAYIGSEAFSNCTGLKNVTIEGNKVSIGSSAFPSADVTIYGLEDSPVKWYAEDYGIDFVASKKLEKWIDGFKYEISNCEIVIVKYDSARNGGSSSTDDLYTVNIPSEIDGYPVTAIGPSAFAGNKKICFVDIPYSVREIGVSAFSGCSNLTMSIDVLPEELITIGESAFAGTLMQDGALPGKLRNIKSKAFSNCKDLRDVYIPLNVTEIADDAFAGDKTIRICCKNGSYAQLYAIRKNIPIGIHGGDYVYYVGNGAEIIKYTGYKTDVVLPDEILSEPVTRIGSNAFADNQKINSVLLPNTVEKIGLNAFANCTRLRKINLPASVKTIESYAFYDAKALKSVTIPQSVKNIGYLAFPEVSTFTIYGYEGTAAQKYANACPIKFVSLSPKTVKLTSAVNVAGGITVKWERSTIVDGYKLQRSVNGGSYKTVFTSTGNKTLSYTDKGATTNGAKYTYRILTYVKKNGTTYNSAASKVLTTYRLSKPSITSLSSKDKGTIATCWSKNAKASGYQIKLVSGTKTKTVTIGKASTVSKKITKLGSKKVYKVSVRAFKTVNKTKYYAAWSATKKVTTK